MRQRNKVLILLPVFDLGGAEKQGLYIANSLQKSGEYEVEVWALEKGSGNLCKPLNDLNLRNKGLEIRFDSFYNRKKRLKVYWKFLWQLRKSKFDIIIPFTYHCNVLSASTFRFAGVKKCIWFQIAMEFHIPLSFFEKLAIKFKPIYAANSIAAASFIGEKHQVDLSKIAFIPNPFEPLEIKMSRADWRLKLNVKPKEIMLFIAANFFPEKDHETLVKGFAMALKTHSNLKLILAGNQNNIGIVNKIKAKCFDLGLNLNHILFIGSSDDIPGLISASDICLLTSVSEGSPNALIEYMGYGKPIVASNIPAISELLNPDYPFLFEKSNAADLSHKLIEIITKLETTDLDESIKNNQKCIINNYTIEANFKAFHKIIAV